MASLNSVSRWDEVVELGNREQAFLGVVTATHRFPLSMVNVASTIDHRRSAPEIGEFSTAC